MFQVMILLQKTSTDWWSVRRTDGSEGYVPANHCKDIDPKVVQKKVKRKVMVPEKVLVTKTGTKKELQTVKKAKKKPKESRGSKIRRTPSGWLECGEKCGNYHLNVHAGIKLHSSHWSYDCTSGMVAESLHHTISRHNN